MTLIDELRYEDHSLEFFHAEPGLNDAMTPPKRDEVALVWCVGSSISLPVALSNDIASRGTPVVAIADESIAELFDFNSGCIELCFNPPTVNEVRGRIKTVKARATIQSAPTIVHGDLTIDVNSFAVSLNGRNIELTYKEYELLKLFASNPGRVFRREDIFESHMGRRLFWRHPHRRCTRPSVAEQIRRREPQRDRNDVARRIPFQHPGNTRQCEQRGRSRTSFCSLTNLVKLVSSDRCSLG